MCKQIKLTKTNGKQANMNEEEQQTDPQEKLEGAKKKMIGKVTNEKQNMNE